MNKSTLNEEKSAPYIGFRLGREYSLSTAEILSLIQAHGLNLHVYDCTEYILVVENKCKEDYVHPLTKSGGTVKIFELPFLCDESLERRTLRSWMDQIHLVDGYLRNALYGEKKFVFGVSTYPLSDFEGDINDLVEYNEFFGLFLKDKFKEYGLNPGFLTARTVVPELTSQEIEKKALIERSFELITCIGRERILLGKTVWIQDYQKFEKRDISRPKRMPEIMTPTKLSLMLLNLSLKGNSQRFLDPFCGTGTILQEALLKGLEIYGADLDPKCVEATKENLKWLVREFNIKGQDKFLNRIFQCDIRNISAKVKSASIDAIATEPYLGPPLRGSPSLRQVRETVSSLQHFYSEALEELNKVLKDAGRMVMTFPIYRVKDRKIFIPLEDILGNMFKVINPLAFAHPLKKTRFTRRNTLIYYRETQKVGREIVILEKR